jgi:dipeptidyl aminopeptidase/acylaminoacyl peptidase
MPTRCVFLASALVFAVAASGAAKRGVTAEDYFAFESPSDAHISPDGKQVAYVLTTIDQKANRRRTAVWAVAAEGNSAPRRLSAENFNSNAPRWSPDGTRLAFLSSRNPEGAAAGEAQIWILRLDGGEAQMLTNLKNGVNSFQWSPDSTRFVVVNRTGPSDNIPLAQRKSDVRHYTHISYKFNDTGWYDDKRSHGGWQMPRPAPRSRSPPAKTGTRPIRSGRPIRRASRSYPTAPARSTTRATIKMSG